MNPEISLSEKLLCAYARRFPVRRGKMRVVNALWHHVVPPNDTLRTARLKMGGFTMPCDLRELLQRQFYFFGTYWVEEGVLDCWAEFARGARVVFDVGANAGIYSLAALAVRPEIVVHAFEPTPAIAQRLRETATLNRLNNLNVHELAVARNSGEAHLNVCRGEDGCNDGMNFITAAPRSADTLRVQTVSLDDFCADHAVEHIDLLKLDIQGNEAEALGGAARLLAEGGIGTVFTELNWSNQRDDACSATATIDLLASHGFIFAEPTKKPTFRLPGPWMRTLSEVVAGRP